jgi:hypothetical protein
MNNSAPAHSYYGRPQGDYRLAHIEGARLAAASAPYLGRGNKCAGNDDTCEGMKAKGTDFCMGHLRKMAKETAKPTVSEEVTTDGADQDDAE